MSAVASTEPVVLKTVVRSLRDIGFSKSDATARGAELLTKPNTPQLLSVASRIASEDIRPQAALDGATQLLSSGTTEPTLAALAKVHELSKGMIIPDERRLKLAVALVKSGNVDETIRTAERIKQLHNSSASTMAFLDVALALARTGTTEQVLAIAKRINGAVNVMSPVERARTLLTAGNVDETIDVVTRLRAYKRPSEFVGDYVFDRALRVIGTGNVDETIRAAEHFQLLGHKPVDALEIALNLTPEARAKLNASFV